MEAKRTNKDKILNELNQLKEALKNIDVWKMEIKLIDEKVNAFSDRDLGITGFSSGGKTHTLDDLLMNDEAKKNLLESNIIRAEYKLKNMNIYINELNEDEKEVINQRYIVNPKYKNSFDYIANKMNFSKSTIKRTHDSAINKIALMKYESSMVA